MKTEAVIIGANYYHKVFKSLFFLSLISFFSSCEEPLSSSSSSTEVGSSPALIGNNTTLPVGLTGSDSLEINWTPATSAETVILQYSNDNGTTWNDFVSEIDASLGSRTVDLSSLADGAYKFRLVASSNTGGTQIVDLGSLIIDNSDPIAPADKGPLSFNEDSSGFNFSLNEGTDDNELTYVITQSPSISEGILYGCTGGDGATDCTFIPTADYSGTVTIKYKARDVAGNLFVHGLQ